jgi:hypothetical protein
VIVEPTSTATPTWDFGDTPTMTPVIIDTPGPMPSAGGDTAAGGSTGGQAVGLGGAAVPGPGLPLLLLGVLGFVVAAGRKRIGSDRAQGD